MSKFQITRGHSNGGMFSVAAICFVSFLVLFAWQTWEFVNWLFPDDQLLMKGLTLFSFDIMCFIWTVMRQFYRFAHPHAKSAVQWGKWITFVCSLVASVIYMTLIYIVRFQGTVAPGLVMISEGVSMVVLVLDILLLMIFLSSEINVRYPNTDEYELVDIPTQHMPRVQARLANTQKINLIEEENQVENGDNQVDFEDDQLETDPNLEIPYTHNGNAKKSWGGKRRNAGRK